MKIAGDDNVFSLDIDGKATGVRPTLRRAIKLQADYRGSGNGLQALARDISDGGCLLAAVTILSLHDHDIPDLAETLLRDGLAKHQAALTAFVVACAGIDTEPQQKATNKPQKAKGADKPQTYDEYLAGLYRIGTGWLGWTPEVTLNATPTEINEAYAGKLDMLKAVYGGGDKKDASSADRDGPWDRNVRSIFGGLGTIKVVEGEEHVG